MLCYQDMTFCKFWEECKKGKDCHRALTPLVEEGADNFGLPVCEFTEEPDCFTNGHEHGRGPSPREQK